MNRLWSRKSLHDAASEKNLQLVKKLIANGSCEQCQNDQFSPQAALVSSLEFLVEIVECLLEASADSNAGSMPLLRMAVKMAKIEALQLLLEHGANIDGIGSLVNRRTALFDAVSSGHLAIAQLLIDHGADVNARDYRQQTPLEGVYCRDCTMHVIQLLSRVGCDMNAADDEGSGVWLLPHDDLRQQRGKSRGSD